MASTQYHCFLLLLSLANLITSISKFIGKLKHPENVRKKNQGYRWVRWEKGRLRGSLGSQEV